MINIRRHILRNPKGSEENVKAKIILPLLARLGWDIVEDCYFEEAKADIFIEHAGMPAFIIETKSWDQNFHYGQGLEYAAKLLTPWVVFTSGKVTEIHHALILNADLNKPKPVLKLPYKELLDSPDALKPYLSLEAFQGGFEQLCKRAHRLLPAGFRDTDWAYSEKAFRLLCKDVGFTRDTAYIRMSDKELDESVALLPTDIQSAYRNIINAVKTFAEGCPRLRCRCSGYAFNLEAIDSRREKVGRIKWLGLFGVFPEQKTLSKGLMNWKSLGLSNDLVISLKMLKAPRKSGAEREIISVLQKCLGAIGLLKGR